MTASKAHAKMGLNRVKEDEVEKKKIGIQLPRQANPEAVKIRYALELEALEPYAEIIEIEAATAEEFAAGVKDMDAIITSWGFRIDAELINNLNKCVVIGVGSVGVDMVDIEAATAAGIVVTNVPDVFIEEVADHAMMLLLASARRMKTHGTNGRRWTLVSGPLLNHIPRLMGQTLGLYAFGNVARCTARRAQAFGMRVIAYDPYVSELTLSEAGVEPVSLHELFADPTIYHYTPQRRNPPRRECSDLALMQPHAVIVNTARGPLIDETALVAALNSRNNRCGGSRRFGTRAASTRQPALIPR